MFVSRRAVCQSIIDSRKPRMWAASRTWETSERATMWGARGGVPPPTPRSTPAKVRPSDPLRIDHDEDVGIGGRPVSGGGENGVSGSSEAGGAAGSGKRRPTGPRREARSRWQTGGAL